MASKPRLTGGLQNEIKKEPGVYVLILHLKRSTTIKIGRFGELKFEAGWYAYVGSSCLPGGLRNRTDRHKRRGKNNHWHVDYFREHAELVEIWFSHVDATHEHHWAKSLAALSCAEVPVAKFGSSDCSAGCPAHFFRFRRRPVLSLFRSLTCGVGAPPIYAQKQTRNADGPAEAEWEQRFWLGERILEESRMRLYEADLPLPFVHDIGKVGCNKALSDLLDRYAADLGIKRKDVLETVTFAAAINQLVEKLGFNAFEVLFLANEKQKGLDIMRISRKSIERQTERFEKVKNGKAKSVAPMTGDLAPDTMKFSKFFSRLGRARGPVVQAQLLSTSRGSTSSEDATLISELLSSYRAELSEFRKQILLVDQLPVDLKCADRKKKVTEPAKSIMQLKVSLSAGLGMLRKNNRDLPRSSYDLRPTPGQHKRVIDEIGELIEMVEQLL